MRDCQAQCAWLLWPRTFNATKEITMASVPTNNHTKSDEMQHFALAEFWRGGVRGDGIASFLKPIYLPFTTLPSTPSRRRPGAWLIASTATWQALSGTAARSVSLVGHFGLHCPHDLRVSELPIFLVDDGAHELEGHVLISSIYRRHQYYLKILWPLQLSRRGWIETFG